MSDLRKDRGALTEAARTNIGRRCRWADVDGIRGTIVRVDMGWGGWPVYVVEWDAGAPDWWSDTFSTSPSKWFVIEDPA